jgi:hypothetical protein
MDTPAWTLLPQLQHWKETELQNREQKLDQMLADSMDASDPPSFTPMTGIRIDKEKIAKARPTSRILRSVGFLFALGLVFVLLAQK